MINYDDIASGALEVAVVGLGYVGLPLAVALGDHFKVIGFDISKPRIDELRKGQDSTREVEPKRLARAKVEYTDDSAQLARAGIIVVAVPTPIDGNRKPDLRPVVGATVTVGTHMRRDCIVVYESTVYPGLTEEICVPLLEEKSGLICGKDFTVGYSPERINPGDKVHTLESIVKVVAGQDQPTADLLARFYACIVKAGVHRASSIKVAEAAKVIENTQRDLNIALMNELALIFDRMGIDTNEVLQAAGTKWNFLPFRPGLVGGHCIGVDPYYLTFKAESIGFHPQVILAGRRINDGMGKFIAEKTIKALINAGCLIKGARVGLLGLTFKENVPDLRNSRVEDIIHELSDYHVSVLVHDPLANPEEARHEYGVELLPLAELRDLDALILAVSHAEFAQLDAGRIAAMFKHPASGIVIDVKGFLDKESLSRQFDYWRL
ncbi:MAG: nucleotide sugar dehydrogenase [Desulfomicrobium sp.]|nr:nucleotide sugar dehydrogenase [Pseudomonadota bacterium]MBV1712742.1 nucleotide sugar dehydrogenase [Desulfomicrobium sp.]MBU4571712.1 nucleotide sugar dehydrogenase [Pseudomonadota bacterium]MBU4595861.1 nucleotide sugar dehydrogenase [Pseudomonadota bacterium]MBV1721165.1 nucleotide sugar dehydrogenase [Desulfomicrobium sp.]